MRHHGSRQVGGYRSIPADEQATEIVEPDEHGRLFHRKLRQLRSALYADDNAKVARLEREIDQVVKQWST